MQSTDWRRVETLFHRALALDAEERDAWLESLRADEPARVDEVLDMLRAHRDEAALGLERRLLAPELDAAEAVEATEATDPLLGTTFGPYRVLELLGRGGMGHVYLGERADREFSQQVAIKVLTLSASSAEARDRFRVERQVLASLQHPAIVPLLDGGVSDDGLPYLVMQRVEGEPITVHCRRRELPLDARLELFRTVCEAVHFAHTRLVVHRDLKPSNILVATDGHVRLLDFGIAKLLDPERLGVEAVETRASKALLTPQYASPEQVRGEAVTTATDVQALGLLLFELLTDRRARRVESPSLTEIVRLICFTEPTPPSEVAASPARARRLRGDLDTIALRAMHPEPQRRYPSARDLGADVGRHLAGEAIEARRDDVGYRIERFARRHPLGVGAGIAVVLLVVAFALVAWTQSRAFERQRDAARLERDRARQVTELLVDVFDADPYADDAAKLDALTVRELLLRSEERVREGLDEQPAVRATVLSLLGRLHGNLGRLERAETLLRDALEAQRRVDDPGDRTGVDGLSIDLAETLNYLATVLQYQGRYDDAEEAFREALAVRLALHGEDHLEVAESLNNLSVVLWERGDERDWEESEALDRRALAVRRRVLGDEHPEVAQSLNNLGAFYYARARPGDLEQAVAHYREALAIRRARLGAMHPHVATTQNNLANALHDLGRLDQAEALFRSAIDGWSASLGPEHARVAIGLYGLSDLLRDRGALDDAIAACRRAVAIESATLPVGHPYRADGALRLGRLLLAAGRAPEAVGPLREAVAALERADGDDELLAAARAELERALEQSARG